MEFSDEIKMEFRSIIIDHYSNPKNKKPITIKKNFYSAKQKSAVCADELDVQLEIVDDEILNGNFDGIGCAFSIAAADILIDTIKNMKINEAYDRLKNYFQMCIGNDFEINNNDELKIFQTVRVEINRVNCVLLSAEAIRHIIEKYKENN